MSPRGTPRPTAHDIAAGELLDELLDTLHDYRQRGIAVTAEELAGALEDMAHELDETTTDPDRWLRAWQREHPDDEGDYDGDDWRRDERTAS